MRFTLGALLASLAFSGATYAVGVALTNDPAPQRPQTTVEPLDWAEVV